MGWLGKTAGVGGFFTLLFALTLPTQAFALAALYGDHASWSAAAPTPQAPVDLSGIADGALLTSISLPFAETLTFDQTVTKLSVDPTRVNRKTWSGCPPTCPDVLMTSGETLTATFSPTGLVGAFGFEMEPYFPTDFSMTLHLTDGTSLTQTVPGLAGAEFFGWVGGSVVDFTATCTGCSSFALGKLVKAEAVPEPGTLGLLGTGLTGLSLTWLRRRKVLNAAHVLTNYVGGKEMKKFLLAMIAVGMLLGVATANAAPVLGGGWAGDNVYASLTDSFGSPYAITLVDPALFSITDAFFPGDIFQVYDGDTPILLTAIDPAPNDPFPPSDSIADAAWADPTYSHGQIMLAAGTHSLRVQDLDCVSFGCPAGFYTRLDVLAVPEPGTLLLLASGLLVGGGFARRFRREV